MSDRPTTGSEKPDWRDLWRKSRERLAGEKAVVAAIAEADGMSRAERRDLAEKQMRARGLPPDPIWVERKLDECEWSPRERARHKAQTRSSLAGAAAGLIRSARKDGSRGIASRIAAYASSESDPPWMQPPGKAIYRASPSPSQRAAVVLDPSTEPLLDEAMASSSRRLVVAGQIAVDVWLDHQLGGELVEVHLGQLRLGAFGPEISQRLEPLMAAAALQRMKPRMTAQLARAPHLRPPYLLVLNVPEQEGQTPSR